MSYQLRSRSESVQSCSFWVTVFKHVVNRPVVDGKGPLSTQNNSKRTGTGVFRRSDSKYSSGRIGWKTYWPRIIFTSSTSITSLPIVNWSRTSGLTVKEEQKPPEWTGVNLSSSIWVSTTLLELIPCTVYFVGVPHTSNLRASSEEIQEWLHAESHKTKNFSDFSESLKVAIPLPMFVTILLRQTETEGRHEVTSFFFWVAVVTLHVVVSPLLPFSDSGFLGKILSAPCRKVLCVLPQPSLVHFRGWGQLRNDFCPLGHKKQSLFSATTFARSVGVFFRNAWHRHNGCSSLQTTQLT